MEEINEMLEKLKSDIMEEYDSSSPISIRVRLLPRAYNSMSEYEKGVSGSERTIKINESNRHEDPSYVVIHETSLGKNDRFDITGNNEDIANLDRPDKAPAYEKDWRRYDKMLNERTTIGYHARIDFPGTFGRNEIVINMPAVCSPSQVGNANINTYVYGIERCVGEEQNYHLSIANQAMLTAFVLREMGYKSKEEVQKHFFPHNFFAKNSKACPARMLYATYLINKGQKGSQLSSQELEDIKEFVPWQVFRELVLEFFERDKYPQELEEKFIYDMSDYEAYVANPKGYNYSERRKEKNHKRQDPLFNTEPVLNSAEEALKRADLDEMEI